MSYEYRIRECIAIMVNRRSSRCSKVPINRQFYRMLFDNSHSDILANAMYRELPRLNVYFKRV